MAALRSNHHHSRPNGALSRLCVVAGLTLLTTACGDAGDFAADSSSDGTGETSADDSGDDGGECPLPPASDEDCGDACEDWASTRWSDSDLHNVAMGLSAALSPNGRVAAALNNGGFEAPSTRLKISDSAGTVEYDQSIPGEGFYELDFLGEDLIIRYSDQTQQNTSGIRRLSSSGETIWDVSVENGTGLVAAVGDRIWLASNQLRAFNAESGDFEAQFDIPLLGPAQSATPVEVDGQLLLFVEDAGGADHMLHFDASGQIGESILLDGDVHSVNAGPCGTIVLGVADPQDGLVVRLIEPSGEEIWERPIEGAAIASEVAWSGDEILVLALDEGQDFDLTTHHPKLHRFQRDGSRTHTTIVPDDVSASAVVTTNSFKEWSPGHLVVGADFGAVYFYSNGPEAQPKLWAFDL